MAKYSFSAKVWKYDGPASWYFVTLPKLLSKSIRKKQGLSEEGWGRLKTKVKMGTSQWETAIWYDTRAGSYLLPIKAEIRKKNKIETGQSIEVSLHFETDRTFNKIKRFIGKNP